MPFTENLLDRVWESLRKIGDLVADGESISQALRNYLDARKKINKYRLRLQDAPMFPVLADKEAFTEYLVAYEKLLISINSDFSKIWQIAPSNAKEIVNTIISMDNVFVEGENNFHAMPTPLNPLFLWKYIKLADEILDSKGVESTEEGTESDISVALLTDHLNSTRSKLARQIGKRGVEIPIHPDFLVEQVDLQNEPQNEPQSEPQRLGALEEAILNLIRLDGHVTRDEMASQMKVSLSTVKRSINKLKDIGLIEYEGSSKSGYWIIKQ